MITLINEQLYKNKDVEIYKCYCPNKALFGLILQTKEGKKESEAIYKHIFPYFANGKGIVVTTEDRFFWVDTSLVLSYMSNLDEDIAQSFYKANSRCNCFGTSEECKVCRKGIIQAPGNFRKITGHDNQTFQYETELGAYRITMIEEPSMGTRYDYLWPVSDFEENLQAVIDYFEEAEKGCNDRILEVCVSEHTEQNSEKNVRLTSFYVHIEAIDLGLSTKFTETGIHLGLL